MPILTQEDARALARRVLSMATGDASVVLNGGRQAHLRFAANTVTTSGDADDLEVTVTAYDGKRRATVGANQTDDATLRRLVEQAERLAKLAPEDPEHLPLLGPQEYTATPAWVEATANLPAKARSEAAGRAIREATARKLVGAGFYRNSGGFRALANSKNLFAYRTASDAGFTMTVRTPDGAGSGYAAAASHDAARLDTAAVAATAAEKALASREARELPPGAYTVVLEAQAVADLLATLNFALNARSADEGRSVFSAPGGKNRIGEKIFAPLVNLYCDPASDLAPGSPFSEEGLPSRKIPWVRQGVLENLVYTRFWAEKSGKQPTGFPTNMIMDGGRNSLDDLIAATEKGLLITRFWYIRPVNPQTMLLTGLTRDVVFFIERGKVQYPVRNFRFNESPVEMLKNAEMLGPQKRVGSSEQGRFAMVLPAIKARSFRFTSLSEAV